METTRTDPETKDLSPSSLETRHGILYRIATDSGGLEWADNSLSAGSLVDVSAGTTILTEPLSPSKEPNCTPAAASSSNNSSSSSGHSSNDRAIHDQHQLAYAFLHKTPRAAVWTAEDPGSNEDAALTIDFKNRSVRLMGYSFRHGLKGSKQNIMRNWVLEGVVFTEDLKASALAAAAAGGGAGAAAGADKVIEEKGAAGSSSSPASSSSASSSSSSAAAAASAAKEDKWVLICEHRDDITVAGAPGDLGEWAIKPTKDNAEVRYCKLRLRIPATSWGNSSRNRALNLYNLEFYGDLFEDDNHPPRYWKPHTGKSLAEALFFELDPNSKEYQDVAKAFLSQMSSAEILKIERVQNPALFERYRLLRQQVADKAPNKNPNEQVMYHGTDRTCIQSISDIGFRRSFARTVTYGSGLSFAGESAYAAFFAKEDAAKVQRMFSCRVVVGMSSLGRARLDAPDFKPSSTTERCETTTDRIVQGVPNIIVTYNDDQAYPEFLITFVKVSNKQHYQSHVAANPSYQL